MSQCSITGNSQGSECYRLERSVAGRDSHSLETSALSRRTKITGARSRGQESIQHPASNGLAQKRDSGDSPCLITPPSLFAQALT